VFRFPREDAPEASATATSGGPSFGSDADPFDVFYVHQRFAINDPSGCIHHASRTLLLSGSASTGAPDYQDIEEARDSLNRWLQLNQHQK
jgi:hypothetical protein